MKFIKTIAPIPYSKERLVSYWFSTNKEHFEHTNNQTNAYAEILAFFPPSASMAYFIHIHLNDETVGIWKHTPESTSPEHAQEIEDSLVKYLEKQNFILVHATEISEQQLKEKLLHIPFKEQKAHNTNDETKLPLKGNKTKPISLNLQREIYKNIIAKL